MNFFCFWLRSSTVDVVIELIVEERVDTWESSSSSNNIFRRILVYHVDLSHVSELYPIRFPDNDKPLRLNRSASQLQEVFFLPDLDLFVVDLIKSCLLNLIQLLLLFEGLLLVESILSVFFKLLILLIILFDFKLMLFLCLFKLLLLESDRLFFLLG